MMAAGAFFAAARQAPVVELDAITGGCALILAPHPDDESLGCGGLIAASCAAGQPPVLVVLTDGVGSHPRSRSHPPTQLRALREAEVAAAAACLGLPDSRIVFLRVADTMAPTTGPAFDAVVGQVVEVAHRFGCRTLLASWQHDPHCDHEAAALVAVAASRQTGIPHRAYPVWGRNLPADTPITPAVACRLDVTPWQEAKRQAILCHRSQWAGVITDDPTGFQMSPAFMALFDTKHELFLEMS